MMQASKKLSRPESARNVAKPEIVKAGGIRANSARKIETKQTPPSFVDAEVGATIEEPEVKKLQPLQELERLESNLMQWKLSKLMLERSFVH